MPLNKETNPKLFVNLLRSLLNRFIIISFFFFFWVGEGEIRIRLFAFCIKKKKKKFGPKEDTTLQNYSNLIGNWLNHLY